MEQELKLHIIRMKILFCGLTSTDLRRRAFEFTEVKKISRPSNKNRKMAGRDWAQNFIKRQGDLPVRCTQNTRMASVASFSREEVSRFFELLKQLMEQYKFSVYRIYNRSETGINMV
jgi:hypothetical protein